MATCLYNYKYKTSFLECSTILYIFEPTVTLNGNPISPHTQCHAFGFCKLRERKTANEAAVTHLAIARSQKAGNGTSGYCTKIGTGNYLPVLFCIHYSSLARETWREICGVADAFLCKFLRTLAERLTQSGASPPTELNIFNPLPRQA